jgi:hypothetical protein
MRWAGHVAHKGKRRVTYGVLVGKPEGHLENLCIDGRIILKKIIKKCGSTDCISVAQDRDGWRAVVNAVMNLRVT